MWATQTVRYTLRWQAASRNGVLGCRCTMILHRIWWIRKHNSWSVSSLLSALHWREALACRWWWSIDGGLNLSSESRIAETPLKRLQPCARHFMIPWDVWTPFKAPKRMGRAGPRWAANQFHRSIIACHYDLLSCFFKHFLEFWLHLPHSPISFSKAHRPLTFQLESLPSLPLCISVCLVSVAASFHAIVWKNRKPLTYDSYTYSLILAQWE